MPEILPRSNHPIRHNWARIVSKETGLPLKGAKSEPIHVPVPIHYSAGTTHVVGSDVDPDHAHNRMFPSVSILLGDGCAFVLVFVVLAALVMVAFR